MTIRYSGQNQRFSFPESTCPWFPLAVSSLFLECVWSWKPSPWAGWACSLPNCSSSPEARVPHPPKKSSSSLQVYQFLPNGDWGWRIRFQSILVSMATRVPWVAENKGRLLSFSKCIDIKCFLFIYFFAPTLYFIYYYFILFFNFTILYWFCHMSTWIRHRYTHVPHPEIYPPVVHSLPLSLLPLFLLFSH